MGVAGANCRLDHGELTPAEMGLQPNTPLCSGGSYEGGGLPSIPDIHALCDELTRGRKLYYFPEV